MHKIWLTLITVFMLTSCGSFWSSTSSEHVVSKGDTLYNISKRYDIPLRDLIDFNNLKPPYTLKIGQTLQIPVSNFHIVAKGDTMYNISKRYDMTVENLAKINDIHPPYTLMIGQRLALYGNTVTTSAPPQTNTTPAKPTIAQTKKPTTSTPKQVVKAQPKKTLDKSKPVSSMRKTKFAWPVRGKVISKYGTIGKGRANDGINIEAPRGTPVTAADTGIVAYAGNELRGFGNLVLIRHNDGWITAYAHNDRILVAKGQEVKKGEKIATVGSTGGVSTAQLHFETRAGKRAVNPMHHLP